MPCLQYRDRHKCPACRTLLKLYNGIRSCPCGHDGRNKQLLVDYNEQQLWLHDLDTRTDIGEVYYARGLIEHPDYFIDPNLAATVHAARDTGVLLSPTDPSSSDDDDQTADYDEGLPLHGFSPEATESQDLASSEDEPGPSQPRKSSTRYDLLDDEAAAPHQVQAGVPPDAPAAPPEQSATPPRSPLPYQLRSGRTHKGAPKKKRGGTRGRR